MQMKDKTVAFIGQMVKHSRDVKALSDLELSDAVIEEVWATIPMHSRASSLVSELTDRFRNLTTEQED